MIVFFLLPARFFLQGRKVGKNHVDGFLALFILGAQFVSHDIAYFRNVFLVTELADMHEYLFAAAAAVTDDKTEAAVCIPCADLALVSHR